MSDVRFAIEDIMGNRISLVQESNLRAEYVAGYRSVLSMRRKVPLDVSGHSFERHDVSHFLARHDAQR